jgi:hypothetical protein
MTTSTFLEIAIGVAPNDGTGDPIRDAFDKVNKNFATIFTTSTLVTVSGLKLTDLSDTPKEYTFTVPPGDGVFVLTSSNTSPLNTYTNKYFKGGNDITVVQAGTNVVVSHLYTATTTSIANTLVLRDGSGNIPGALGYTGSAGSGFTGSSGTIGPIGPLGYTGSGGGGGGGPIGPIGYDGSIGLTGFTGSAGGGGGGGGPIGPIGPTGYDGSIGFIGSRGFTGSSAGFTGSVGFTGSIGGPTVYISFSPPGSPVTGDFWAVPL